MHLLREHDLLVLKLVNVSADNDVGVMARSVVIAPVMDMMCVVVTRSSAETFALG